MMEKQEIISKFKATLSKTGRLSRGDYTKLDFYPYVPKITNNFTKNIYLFMQDMDSEPSCKQCNRVTTKFINFNQGYLTFCSTTCSTKNSKLNRKGWHVGHYPDQL